MKALADWKQRSGDERLHILWIGVILPASGLVVLLLAAARGYLIGLHAVDMPYWDEWDQIWGLDSRLDLSWLWGLHNEHRIVTTRIVIWLLYRVDGWNLVTGLWVNYAVYLLIPVLIFVIARRESNGGHWALLPFLPFFFSNMGVESDVWGFDIAWRFFVVFLLLAILFLFDRRQRWGAIGAGAVCLVLSIYSLASGIPASLAVVVVYSGFKLYRVRAGFPAAREWRGLAVSAAVVILAAAAWFIGWHQHPGHPPLELPVRWEFWDVLLRLVSVGIQPPSAPVGGVMLAALGAMLAIEWRRQRGQPAAGMWSRMALLASCLAALASISMARAAFGTGAAGSSRYSELALLLLPVLVLGANAVLERRDRRWFLALVFTACAMGYSNRWDERPYRIHEARLTSGVECLQRNLKQGRPLDCETLLPWRLDSYVERAKQLDLSSYRKYLANVN